MFHQNYTYATIKYYYEQGANAREVADNLFLSAWDHVLLSAPPNSREVLAQHYDVSRTLLEQKNIILDQEKNLVNHFNSFETADFITYKDVSKTCNKLNTIHEYRSNLSDFAPVIKDDAVKIGNAINSSKLKT